MDEVDAGRAHVKHGLVLGKFYPPHAGHHLLVRTAAAVCERVTVLVLASSVESIPLDERVAWMRELHPGPNVRIVGGLDDFPVDYTSEEAWRNHIGLFERLIGDGTPVDAVFTSEPYGEELGRRMNAKSICVDVDRTLAPYSGTAIRADPVATWEGIAEPVRGYLARRVVLVGAESTGKTTLAIDLCDALRRRGGSHGLTRWVPEVGRDVTADKLAIARARAAIEHRPPPRVDDVTWRTEDFADIARAQQQREDALARLGGPVLLCDTDAFTTGLWHERYLGAPRDFGSAHPLYLLLHPDDVPFVQDGLRDGENIRQWMTTRFLEKLTATGRRFAVIRGTRDQRLALCLAQVDQLISEGWKLADPLS